MQNERISAFSGENMSGVESPIANIQIYQKTQILGVCSSFKRKKKMCFHCLSSIIDLYLSFYD